MAILSRGIAKDNCLVQPKTIHDVPVEILLQIIAWLPIKSANSPRGGKWSRQSAAHQVKLLRLTSRLFASILAPELLQAIHIDSSAAGKEFLEWCTASTTKAHTRPTVRRLSLGNICHNGMNNPEIVPYAIAEEIMSALAPSLLQLQIKFHDFALSESLISNLGCAKQLTVLHLHQIAPRGDPICKGSPLTASHYQTSGQLHDPLPLFIAIAALPSLVELNINGCLDHCSPLTSPGAVGHLPSVQHLAVNLDREPVSFANNQHNTLIHLCRALKTSLKILEIRGSRYDSTKLVPVLETVHQSLEALHFSEASLVYHCDGLRFPQLRTIHLDDSRYLSDDDFDSPIFEEAVTIVVRTWSENDAPLVIPVWRLSKLKRVILSYTSRPSSEIITLSRACEASNIDLFLTSGPVDLRELNKIDALHPRQARNK